MIDLRRAGAKRRIMPAGGDPRPPSAPTDAPKRREEIMSRLLQPFRRLHWQFTLTYIVITLAAALTIEMANVASYAAKAQSPAGSTPDVLLGDMGWLAPQVAPYLDAAAPNTAALSAVATDLARTLGPKGPAGKTDAEGQTSRFQSPLFMLKSRGARVSVALLGGDDRVVAAASSDDITSGDVAADTRTRAAVAAALSGGLTGKLPHFLGTLDDGRTVAAVPLLGYDGRRVGLLVIAAQLQPVQTPQPSKWDAVVSAIRQQDLLPSALYFVLLASLLGTLSGLLASRGIRWRLRRIAQAARLWSRGEFQAEIRGGGRDELGRLALDLNGMAARLGQLMTAREELAVVEERHRLARDLHDSVKQQLFVVAMLVGTARTQAGAAPEAERTLAEAERLASAAQQELTALIRALRPVALAGKGLGAALRELLDGWAPRAGVAVTTEIADDLPLGLAAEQELFRVAQEALANVARHSGAASVTVRAEAPGASVVLSVADDGHGFDPTAQVGRGLGLGGMRERVEALGGALLVYSTSAGTRIEARVPASPPRAAPEVGIFATAHA